MKLTTAEFIKNYGKLADKALTEHQERPRPAGDALCRGIRPPQAPRRGVVRLEDFADEEMALIAQYEPPPEGAHLDAELKDWLP
jgi:hypothetical protein